MSVLLLTNTYPTDSEPGATPCLKRQVSALRAQGVEIELFHIDHLNKLNYVRAAWKMFLMSFHRKRYDLIHAHYGHCGMLARLQFKYPVVVTFHGSDLLDRKDRVIGRIAAKLADGVIVMTQQMKCATGRKDAHIIPFGVDTDLFTPYPTAEARRDLGLPLDAELVLFPWNPARPVKRFDIVREAIRILQEKQEKARLIVVYDKPQEVVAKHMNACDVMILASDHEGSPMAVREAMACNLPIVSVDVGDVRQIIEDVEGCYLCEQEAEDLAQKLSWALDRGGRTDGARMIKKLDAAWAARKVISVYDSVLSKSGRGYGG